MIITIGVIIIWLGLQLVFGTQNPFYVVSSGSMVPHLLVYDVIVVQGNDPFEQVQIGDVIVFDRPTGHDRVIVHRVDSIVNDDPFTVRTKGDANPASIPGTDFPITAEEYIGTVVYVIPQVGFITRIFATDILGIPLNYIIIAIIIGAMIAKQLLKTKEEKTIDSDTLDEVNNKKDKKNNNNKKDKKNNNNKKDSAELFGDINIPKDTDYLHESDTKNEPKQNNSSDSNNDDNNDKYPENNQEKKDI